MLAINKDKIQCFFGFRHYKVLTAIISDQPNAHACLSCSSKWILFFFDGINMFYIQPGIPNPRKIELREFRQLQSAMCSTQTK